MVSGGAKCFGQRIAEFSSQGSSTLCEQEQFPSRERRWSHLRGLSCSKNLVFQVPESLQFESQAGQYLRWTHKQSIIHLHCHTS